MIELHIDIETFSAVDLLKVGSFRYANDPSFLILLFSYKIDDQDVVTIDLASGEEVPEWLIDYMLRDDVLKIAQNANFEITCITSPYGLGLPLDPAQWYCTQVGAAYLGLPQNLEKMAQVLKLTEQKDAKGKALIKYFSTPCKPTKTNGGRTRNMPWHAPEKWQQYINYNVQDVKTEDEVYKYQMRFPQPSADERAYWVQDQAINRVGIYIDVPFVEAAIKANEDFLTQVHDEMANLTGIDNPNALAQIKDWIGEELGEPFPTLTAETMEDALASEFTPPHVARLFELRQMANNTSISKYDTMLKWLCDDGRIHGVAQFYGAGRTGRFAGRGVQFQNLKRIIFDWLTNDGRINDERIAVARDALLKGLAELLYDDVSDLVSRLVRTAVIAPPGRSIIACDFSAIEARVLAWLAGEEWVLDVFRGDGKLYEATAAKMFNVPIKEVTKGSPYRAKGKIAALALGYQGSNGALIKMGALREGLEESELKPIVTAWRAANPAIVKFWKECENAAKKAIRDKRTVTLYKKYTKLIFTFDRGYLFITLPSGRRLSYYGAALDPSKYGEKIVYWGVDQTKKTWCKDDTYGGSLVENITQAVARDCLVEAMHEMKDEVNIIFHVHDEIVAEEPDETAHEILTLMGYYMSLSPLWAKELPLSGEGYVNKFYKKD